MPGKLSVYGLGSLGVNVDKNPLNLEDGELTKAQNAIHDPAGSMGGLRNRRGLVKINSVAAAGGIKGAIGVPILAGSAGNETPAVVSGDRIFLFGRRINATTAGWNTSTSQTLTVVVQTGGPTDYEANGTPTVPDNTFGMHGGDVNTDRHTLFGGKPGVVFNNRLYYAGNDYTIDVTSPSIRMWDGEVDYLLGRVSPRSGVLRRAVLCMIVGGDDFIYFTTYDSGETGSSTALASVFQLDPHSGAIKIVGQVFPIVGQNIPYTLAWAWGRLWLVTWGLQAGDLNYRVYSIHPGESATWTLDNTTAVSAGAVDLLSFQGQLFMTMRAGVTVAAFVRVRSAVGAYSTSKTALLDEGGGTPVMADFGISNHFGAMVNFGGNLYVSYFNAQAGGTVNFARIYKFDGTTWTVVYAPAGDHTTAVPYARAFVREGAVYFVSSARQGRTSAFVNKVIRSANGTAWTDISAELDDAMIPVAGVLV